MAFVALITRTLMLKYRFKGFSFLMNIKEKESVYSWERGGGGVARMAAHLGAT